MRGPAATRRRARRRPLPVRPAQADTLGATAVRSARPLTAALRDPPAGPACPRGARARRGRRVAAGHDDDPASVSGRGRPTVTTSLRARAGGAQGGPRGRELAVGAVALEREQPPAGAQQRQRPAGQAVQRRDGPGDDRVDERRAGELLGPGPAHDRGAQPELGDDLLEEGAAPQQRLDEQDGHVGALQRQHHAGQAGAGPDVGDDLPGSSSSAGPAQLSRWRSHSRGASRGPSRPRSTPGPASSAAYASTCGSAAPKTAAPAAGRAARRRAGPHQVPSGRTTTRRSGSSPSDSLRTPGDRGDGVVHDLALERRHGREPHPLPGLGAALGGAGADRGELGLAGGAPAADVEHEPRPHARLAHDREAGQLLHRLEHLPVLADEGVQAVADDRDDGPLALDVHVDVAVDVGDVEQPLEVVAGDVALADEEVLAGQVVGRRASAGRAVLSLTGVLRSGIGRAACAGGGAPVVRPAVRAAVRLRVWRTGRACRSRLAAAAATVLVLAAAGGAAVGGCGDGRRRRRADPRAARRHPRGRRADAEALVAASAAGSPAGAVSAARRCPSDPCPWAPLRRRRCRRSAGGLPGLRLTGGMRLMTHACWPIDHRLVVSQYSSTPIGKIAPETANDSGST